MRLKASGDVAAGTTRCVRTCGHPANDAEELERLAVARRAPGRVDQHGLAARRHSRIRQFGNGARDVERRADDVGVEPQLFDRAHAEAVGGHQAEAGATTCALLGCDLRDGGGLPRSRRAHEDLDGRRGVRPRRPATAAALRVPGAWPRPTSRGGATRSARGQPPPPRTPARARWRRADSISGALDGRGRAARVGRRVVRTVRRLLRPREWSGFRHLAVSRGRDLDDALPEPAHQSLRRAPCWVDSTRAPGPRSSRAAARASLNRCSAISFQMHGSVENGNRAHPDVGGTSLCESTPTCGSTRENSRHRCGRNPGEHKSTGCATAVSMARAMRVANPCASDGVDGEHGAVVRAHDRVQQPLLEAGREADGRQVALVGLVNLQMARPSAARTASTMTSGSLSPRPRRRWLREWSSGRGSGRARASSCRSTRWTSPRLTTFGTSSSTSFGANWATRSTMSFVCWRPSRSGRNPRMISDRWVDNAVVGSTTV